VHAQRRGQLLQLVAWDGTSPIARGMVLYPEHEEYSTSAEREGGAEVRDVFVAEGHRRRGVASELMRGLERAASEGGFRLIGLSVSLSDDSAPARALYDRLGYRHAHGPFVATTILDGDDGPKPVGAVMTYLIKDL
jgi:ribosomal protein S18 acetylase RimI-like enzyme